MKPLRLPVIILLAARACFASPDFSTGMLDRAAALAAAKEVEADLYPDANRVLVDGMQWISYEPDGTYEQWHEEYLKVLTEHGRRDLTTLSSYFTIPYQRGPEDCRISRVEIIKPDGRAIEIDVEAQSRVMVNTSSMSQNIYNPNSKIIRLNVSGLEVGDVLHFVMYDRIVKARMEDAWSDWIVFEGADPIKRSVVEIYAPKEKPLRSIVLKDRIEGTVTRSTGERNGRLFYRWEAKDVPRVFPEPNMPSMHTVVQRLLVSTLSDWETVSRWYWNLSEPHFDATEEMRAKTDEIVDGATDRLGRIRALFRYVSQEIRYMGITVEANAPGYEPHDVKDTFEARHGVCRDKAALLVAMLRLAGIEAFPVLIHSGPKKDAEVPQPFFDHAIVAASYEEEKGVPLFDEPQPEISLLHSSTGNSYILMDPTVETTATLLPAYLNNKSALVATPDGEPLLTSPIDPAENNLVRVTTTGRIDAKGKLTARTELGFGGVNDNVYRGYFARSKAEDRRRFVEGLLRKVVAGAHVTDIRILPENMLDTSCELSIQAEFEAESVAVSGGGKTLLPLPVLGNRVGMVNFVLGKTGLKKRRFPLVTDIACGTEERISLELDPSVAERISLPGESAVSDESFEWRMAVSGTCSVIQVENDFRLKVVEFAPPEYLALKKGLEIIEVALRGMPILDNDEEQAEPDVLIVGEEVEYELSDSFNWTESQKVTKQVLTYAGKKKNAEIKIDYNPAWEEVRLEDVLVTDAEGARHSIQSKELNIMDSPWVGAAPRYPAGKTLVASLPGVDVGSTIEYRIARAVRNRPFFSIRQTFRGLDEIARKSVVLRAPAELELRLGTNLYEGETSRETFDAGGRKWIKYQWTAVDSAPIEREDALPPLWYFNPTLFVSGGSWSEYAREMEEALADSTSRQREAERKAREIIGSERNPWKKLELIRDYVAVHVRNAGPSFTDLPFSSITPADVTLSDGYGNTTDRSILLYVMLRKAGFKPEFVLVSSLPDVAFYRRTIMEYPDPRLFQEVLVRVSGKHLDLQPGEYVYMNDSDQYGAIGACRHEGKPCIVLPGGTLSKVVPARKNMLETLYRLVLSENGDASITKTVSFHGSRYGAENRKYSEMTPEERGRHFQELVAGISQGAEAVGDLETDFSAYPGTVSFTVKARDYAIRSGDYLYFRFPELFDGLFRLRSRSRENPMVLPVSRNRTLTVLCELPAGFDVVILPEDWSCDDVAGADIDISSRLSGNDAGGKSVLRFDAKVRTDPNIISPSHYSAMLDVEKRLSHKQATTVLLRKRK